MSKGFWIWIGLCLAMVICFVLAGAFGSNPFLIILTMVLALSLLVYSFVCIIKGIKKSIIESRERKPEKEYKPTSVPVGQQQERLETKRLNKKQLISALIGLAIIIGMILLIFKTWKIILLALGFTISLPLAAAIVAAFSWTGMGMFATVGCLMLIFVPLLCLGFLFKQLGIESNGTLETLITLILGVPLYLVFRYVGALMVVKRIYGYITGKDTV